MENRLFEMGTIDLSVGVVSRVVLSTMLVSTCYEMKNERF